jgi:hypothetical protein
MDGDDRKRYCGDCKLNVYNLSGMTKYDAEHLLRMSEGRLCVRYFQRPDGTVLTQDCPVGWAKVKQRVTVFAAAAFSLMMSLFGAMFLLSSFKQRTTVMGAVAYPSPTPTPTPKTVPLMGVMGNVSVPTPTPKASPREVKGEVEVMVGRLTESAGTDRN